MAEETTRRERDVSDDELAQFAVDNPSADLCGKNIWVIQMTNGQQMVVKCDTVDIEHGVVCVNGYADDPMLYLPSGSWVAVYRAQKPAGVALPLTHMISPVMAEPPVPEEHTNE